MPSTRVRVSSSFCSGDRVRVTEVSMVAICPIWVFMPVPVTTIDACPWSPTCSGTACSSGPRARTRRRQDGIVLAHRGALPGQRGLLRLQRRGSDDPAIRRNDVTGLHLDQVPGTTSTAGTRTSAPPRTTLACGTCRFDRASTLALAFSSCRDPSTTFSRISRPTMTPVDTCPISETHHGDRDEHDVHRVPQLGQRHHQDRRRLLPR